MAYGIPSLAREIMLCSFVGTSPLHSINRKATMLAPTMDPNEYRTVTFDQSTRLSAGKLQRDQLLNDANTSNDAFERAFKEKEAIEKSGGLCEALALKWLKLKFKENNETGRQKADCVFRRWRSPIPI